MILQRGGAVEARFTVGLPARGRTVLGQWAVQVLVHNLPRYTPVTLPYIVHLLPAHSIRCTFVRTPLLHCCMLMPVINLTFTSDTLKANSATTGLLTMKHRPLPIC